MTTTRSHTQPAPERPMRHRRTLATVALVALVAVGGAACDDDDTNGALGVDAFIDRANAVCRAGIAEIDARMASLGETPSDAELDAAVDFIVDNVSAQVADMQALGPPAAIAEDMEEIWAEVHEILADMRAQGPSVFEGEDPFARLRPRLAEVGLTDC
ncbi:MAG TPA: hypothetical protein VM262_07575 [Acidimicrobiales bacterium]|nr:hypothetical protein [Acidimicrobiales bacterium]